MLCPNDLSEALEMRAAQPEAQPLAGGTDLMVHADLPGALPPLLLNLWGLAELSRVEPWGEGGLRLGALCTYSQLIKDPHVQKIAPSLVEAARCVGARQIQNRGTLGGNLGNASPAGDSLPVLLALDVEIEVQSATRGPRRIAMERFFTGYKSLDMEPDELITALLLPAHPGSLQSFRKVGTRAALSIAKVIMATRLQRDEERIAQVRIAFGSVAATPVRCRGVEAAIQAGASSEEIIDALDIQPVDDVRSTARYRLKVAQNLLRSWLQEQNTL